MECWISKISSSLKSGENGLFFHHSLYTPASNLSYSSICTYLPILWIIILTSNFMVYLNKLSVLSSQKSFPFICSLLWTRTLHSPLPFCLNLFFLYCIMLSYLHLSRDGKNISINTVTFRSAWYYVFVGIFI